MHRSFILSGLSALYSLASAAPSAAISPRQTCEFDSANNPTCWGNYSLSTNWYDEAPDTGVVREFWWEITETTLAPDGFSRPVQTINGTVPGPQITADWGDTISEWSTMVKSIAALVLILDSCPRQELCHTEWIEHSLARY